MDVDSTSLAGTWWRQIPAGSDVYHEPADPADARWQRGTVVEGLYFGDAEVSVWAEWYRWLAEAGMSPDQALPRDLWRWEVALNHVADLTDDDRLGRVGLPPLEPTRHQWPTFQPVGEQLYREGWWALVSASAARPEGRTLCVFRTVRKIPGAEPVAPPTTVDHPPVVPTGTQT